MSGQPSPVKPDPIVSAILNVSVGIVVASCVITILLALARFAWAPWTAEILRTLFR